MIQFKSTSLRDSGSMLKRMLASNISFCLFVVAASGVLVFGVRYLHHQSQVLKLAEAKAAATAAAHRVAAPLATAPVSEPVANPASTETVASTTPAAEVPSNPPPASNVSSSSVPATSVRTTTTTATVQAGDEPPLGAFMPKAEDQPAQKKADAVVAEKAAPVSFADSLMAVISPSAKGASIQPQMLPPAKTAKRAAATTTAAPRPEKPLTAEEKRLKAAQDGFDEIMTLAGKYRDIYGFGSSEDLTEARLGTPIPVCVIAQPGHERYHGQPVKSLLKPAEQWFYPIVLNERVRYMVLVQRVGQEYVLGTGSRAVAVAYEKILARWPASEGYHAQLVLLPSTPFYYFSIPELPFENLTDTSRMFDPNPDIAPAGVQLGSWR